MTWDKCFHRNGKSTLVATFHQNAKMHTSQHFTFNIFIQIAWQKVNFASALSQAHTIDVFDNDYMIKQPYFCIETIITHHIDVMII